MQSKFSANLVLTIGLAAVGLSSFALPVAAQTAAPVTASANSATTPAQAQQTPAGKFIQDLGSKAISVVANKSLSQQQRDDQYRDLLQAAFDLQTIGHFVLGYAWETASAQQRDEYLNLFKALVVKTYGEKLNLYSGEKFVVKSVRPETERDTIVNSEITHADGSPATQVDWRVRDRDGRLAIIDVTVAGVSQSITQRSEYATILQRNNGAMEALLASMRQQMTGKTTALKPKNIWRNYS